MADPPPLVLVVENDKDLSDLLLALLEDEGYRVEPSLDGHHAERRILEGDIDAVLLDLKIPKLDGFQVLRNVRDRERDTNRHLPIMVLAGAASETEQASCMDAGADDYLSQPFDRDDLLNRVYYLVKRYHVTTRQKAPPISDQANGRVQ